MFGKSMMGLRIYNNSEMTKRLPKSFYIPMYASCVKTDVYVHT